MSSSGIKAIIPVAGVGSRLRPHTHTTPKALIHVAGRPILAHILDDLERLGVTDVVLVVGHMSEHIREYVDTHYAHLGRLAGEFLRCLWRRPARKRELVRVEGVEHFTKAWEARRGILVLTGHFGNFEVATIAGLMQFPEVHGHIHFVRRPIKPRWLDRMVNERMRRAGFGTISKRGSLDQVLGLARGAD